MRTKFKLGQFVYAFHSEKIIHGRVQKIIAECHDIMYIIIVQGSYTSQTYIVNEEHLEKSLKRLVRRVIGKNYIYARCLEDFLKNHSEGVNYAN